MKTSHQRRRVAALHFLIKKGSKRLPLTHPQFNLREITKQMVLLEDHLFQAYKRCPDCIRKHLLTIEAFAEEAVTLDSSHLFQEVAGLTAVVARYWMEQFNDKRPPVEIAEEVRQVRKALALIAADPRDIKDRVASRHLSQTSPCPHKGNL